MSSTKKATVDFDALRASLAQCEQRAQAAADDRDSAEASAQSVRNIITTAMSLHREVEENRQRFETAKATLEDLLGDARRTKVFGVLANNLGVSGEKAIEALTTLAVIEYGREHKPKAIAALRARFIDEPEQALARFVEGNADALSVDA